MHPLALTTSIPRSRRLSNTAPRKTSRTIAARPPPISPATSDTSGRGGFRGGSADPPLLRERALGEGSRAKRAGALAPFRHPALSRHLLPEGEGKGDASS